MVQLKTSGSMDSTSFTSPLPTVGESAQTETEEDFDIDISELLELYKRIPPPDLRAHALWTARERVVGDVARKVKDDGIFDSFRKAWLKDLETKPQFQNLIRRVEIRCSEYLSTLTWSPDMNKAHLREKLQKFIDSLNFVDAGIKDLLQEFNTGQYANPLPKQRFEEAVLKTVAEILQRFLHTATPRFPRLKSSREEEKMQFLGNFSVEEFSDFDFGQEKVMSHAPSTSHYHEYATYNGGGGSSGGGSGNGVGGNGVGGNGNGGGNGVGGNGNGGGGSGGSGSGGGGSLGRAKSPDVVDMEISSPESGAGEDGDREDSPLKPFSPPFSPLHTSVTPLTRPPVTPLTRPSHSEESSENNDDLQGALGLLMLAGDWGRGFGEDTEDSQESQSGQSVDSLDALPPPPPPPPPLPVEMEMEVPVKMELEAPVEVETKMEVEMEVQKTAPVEVKMEVPAEMEVAVPMEVEVEKTTPVEMKMESLPESQAPPPPPPPPPPLPAPTDPEPSLPVCLPSVSSSDETDGCGRDVAFQPAPVKVEVTEALSDVKDDSPSTKDVSSMIAKDETDLKLVSSEAPEASKLVQVTDKLPTAIPDRVRAKSLVAKTIATSGDAPVRAPSLKQSPKVPKVVQVANKLPTAVLDRIRAKSLVAKTTTTSGDAPIRAPSSSDVIQGHSSKAPPPRPVDVQVRAPSSVKSADLTEPLTPPTVLLTPPTVNNKDLEKEKPPPPPKPVPPPKRKSSTTSTVKKIVTSSKVAPPGGGVAKVAPPCVVMRIDPLPQRPGVKPPLSVRPTVIVTQPRRPAEVAPPRLATVAPPRVVAEEETRKPATVAPPRSVAVVTVPPPKSVAVITVPPPRPVTVATVAPPRVTGEEPSASDPADSARPTRNRKSNSKYSNDNFVTVPRSIPKPPLKRSQSAGKRGRGADQSAPASEPVAFFDRTSPVSVGGEPAGLLGEMASLTSGSDTSGKKMNTKKRKI